MGKQLYSRSEFARLARVSPTAVTAACKDRLHAACKGSRIDISHPDAVAYLDKNDPLRTANLPNVLPGVDALYQDCVNHANAIGRLSTNSLQVKFGIGYDRAKKIKNLIEAAGAFNDPELNDELAPSVPVVTPTMIQRAQALLDSGQLPNFAQLTTPTLGGDRLRAADERRDTEGSLRVPEDDGDQLPGFDAFEAVGVDSLADWTLRAVVLKYGTHERFRGWLLAYKSLVDIGAKEIANAERRGQLIPRDFVESHVLSHYDRAHINLMTDASQTIARRIVGDIKAGATVEDCEVFVSEQISRHIQEAKASIARALSSV